jgi:hypothetical protein
MTDLPEDQDEEPSIHETVDAPSITRAAVLANKFVDDFFDGFAQAENAEDKKFLLPAPVFLEWVTKQGLMRDGSGEEDDKVVARGRGAVSQDVRQKINSAAEFGKGVWPPYKIAVNKQGALYEVRLLENHIAQLPGDLGKHVLRYVDRKLAYCRKTSEFMHSEKVQKYAPLARVRYGASERLLAVHLRNLVAGTNEVVKEMLESDREAQQLMLQFSESSEAAD